MISRGSRKREFGNRVPHTVEQVARIQSSKDGLSHAIETIQSAKKLAERFDIEKFEQAQRQIRFSLSQLHNYRQRLKGESPEKDLVDRAIELFSHLNENLSVCIDFARGDFTGSEVMANSAVKEHFLPEIHSIFQEILEFDFEIIPVWKRISPRFALVMTLLVAGLAPNVIGSKDEARASVALQDEKDTSGKKSEDGERDSGSEKGEKGQSSIEEGVVKGGYETPNEYEPGIGGGVYGMKIAEIDFSFNHDIGEPLWANAVYQLSSKGTFVKAEVVHIPEDHQSHAWVEVDMDFVSGSVFNLMTPPGFVIGEIEGPPEGSGVKLIVDRKNQRAKLVYPPEMLDEFGSLKKGIDISEFALRYSVVKADQRVEKKDLAMPQLPVEALQQIAIDRLASANVDQFPDIFDDYIQNFTYVTSGKLDAILRELPGTMLEKTALLKIGDCDSLSGQLVYMLKAAGHDGYLVTGILESRDELNTKFAHGKVLYHDNDGTPVTYEATAATKKGFKNVHFSEGDFAQIESMANRISGASLEEAQQDVAALGDMIRSVLDKEDYEVYQDSAVPSTFTEFKDSMMSISRDLNNSLRTPDAWKHILGLLFGLIVVGFASLKGIQKGEKGAKKKYNVDVLRNLEKRFFGETSDFDGEPDQQVAAEIDAFYKTYDLEMAAYLQEVMPKEKLLTLPPEKQIEALKILRVCLYFERDPYGVFGTLKSLIKTRQMNNFLAQMDAEGVPASRMFRRLKEMVTDPKILQQELEQAPAQAQEIVEAALREGSVFVDNQGNLRMIPAEMFVPLGGNLASVSGQEAGSGARRGNTGDFYEHSAYRTGDDLRDVDWRASGRLDGLVVKRRSSPEGKQKRPVHMVLDLAGMKSTHFEKLVGLFAHMQKDKTDVYPKTITLNVCGNSVHRFGSREITQLMSGSIADIQAFITLLLKTRAQEVIDGPQVAKIAYGVIKYLPKDTKRSDWYMVMGAPVRRNEQAADVDWFLNEQWWLDRDNAQPLPQIV